MKNVLLMVTGGSPQVVTETLYGLAVMPSDDKKWIPDEIHIMSTSYGVKKVQELLLDTPNLQNMIDEYDLNFDVDSNLYLHTFIDKEGNDLEHLKGGATSLAGNQIQKIVQPFTEDKDTCIYMCITGGLSSMSYHAGRAMDLFGRKNDKILEVSVDDKFHGLFDFFYPSKTKGTWIKDRNGKELDTYTANIQLEYISFIRLRYALPEKIYNRDLLSRDFEETINIINASIHPLNIILNANDKTIIIDNLVCKLSPLEFSIYCWLAYRHSILTDGSIQRPVSTVNEGKLIQTLQDDFDDFVKRIGYEKYTIIDKSYTEICSDIKRKFTEVFGVNIAERIKIESKAVRGRSLFKGLTPNQFSIDWPAKVNYQEKYKVKLDIDNMLIIINEKTFGFDDDLSFVLYLWIIKERINGRQTLLLSDKDNPLSNYLSEIKKFCSALAEMNLDIEQSLDYKSLYKDFKYMNASKLSLIIENINTDIDTAFGLKIGNEIGIKSHITGGNSLYIPLPKDRFVITQ